MQFVKLNSCEYEDIDKSSAPCHNPPVWLERESGYAVCEAHRGSLETFMTAAIAVEPVAPEVHNSDEDVPPFQVTVELVS